MDGQSKSKYPQAISSCSSPICLEQDPMTVCCWVLSKQCMICIHYQYYWLLFQLYFRWLVVGWSVVRVWQMDNWYLPRWLGAFGGASE